MSYKEISLIGDSIGQGYWDRSGIGWFGRMTQMIGAAYPYAFGFHNASMAGDTVIEAMYRLSAEVQQRHGDYLVICVGVNDVIRWQKPDGQTSLAPITSMVYWDQLLSRAVKSFQKVAVIGCAPVVEGRFPQTGVLDTVYYNRNEDIEAYNLQVSKLCAKYDVPHFPGLFPAMQGRAELYHDATHPNADGHQLIADMVFQFLGEKGWFEQ